MIKIVIDDAVFTTEDFKKIYIDGKLKDWVSFYNRVLNRVPWWEANELADMIYALVKLNEKGFCIKVEYVDGTWDVDILNATPQETIKDPYKKFNGRIDRILGVMAKLP